MKKKVVISDVDDDGIEVIIYDEENNKVFQCKCGKIEFDIVDKQKILRKLGL